jgi:hypothetical protein
MAVTQFFAAPVPQHAPHLAKNLVISPVGLAMGTLSLGVVLLLLGTVWSFLRSLVYFLTGSILLSYPFALYASLFVLACVLVVTRRSYLDIRPGREHQDDGTSKRLSQGSRCLVIALTAVAVVSLALVWTRENAQDGDFFRGFEFLLRQRLRDGE